MSAQALQHIDVLLSRFQNDCIPEQLPGLVDECKSDHPLRALHKVRRLTSNASETGSIQFLVNSGLVPVLIGLIQQNPHNFGMLFSGYIRPMNFQYIIPESVVGWIGKNVALFTVDERIQVECRWILCNIAAGMNDILICSFNFFRIFDARNDFFGYLICDRNVYSRHPQMTLIF